MLNILHKKHSVRSMGGETRGNYTYFPLGILLDLSWNLTYGIYGLVKIFLGAVCSSLIGFGCVPKLDLVVTFLVEQLMAMENFGLITSHDEALLYDEHGSATVNKQRVWMFIAL